MLLALTPNPSVADEIPRPEHPRPDFRRDDWLNLNGAWQFRFDPEDRGVKDEWWRPDAAGFDRKITVPFCWESELSGVHDTSGQKIGWYRRTVRVPRGAGWDGKQIWLRFGAVDWQADVWVNGQKVGTHEGGYTPFEFDITTIAAPGSDATVVVRAFDPTDPSLPTGKQIGWYTTTSGIWQTVWLEARPAVYVASFTVKTSQEGNGKDWIVDVAAEVRGPDGMVSLLYSSPDATVKLVRANGKITNGRGEVGARIDVAQPKLWSPESPHLYDLTIDVTSGTSGDRVHTYFGLRTIDRARHGNLPHELVFLNGKPIYLRGALDQSFNPKGIHTAPSDEFLRKDIELAKSLGLNFLRIHIKSEEPRRLYWADKLGMLIMQDMPNTWRQNARARQAWEQTARETITRDRNHPSIFAWVDFNESWGLGHPEPYKADKDTQQWVKSMVALTRQLDPTRLVEDNSPCYYDHVSVTDLNSWHFYIDDYPTARRHIEEVVAKSVPGSPFNHCPGEAMNTAPLINSEYGSVSAGGGDRDVSWGFRYLTTQLRRHEKIQGYIYTELSDIEWEHNGFVNYDRSPKEFGYDAFVAGMTVADLQGADFVGFDAPPAVETTLSEEIVLPVFISHFSDATSAPKLRFTIAGIDDLGRPVKLPADTRAATWQQYRVTEQEPFRVRVDEKRPFIGAVGVELLDDAGKRIAANFVNLVVRRAAAESTAQTNTEAGRTAGAAPPPSPRVEVLGPRTVALRFRPEDIATAAGDATGGGILPNRGKLFFPGAGSVEYRLKLPDFVRDAGVAQLELLAELSSKAKDERLDWPARRNAQDYPQTDTRKHPSQVQIRLAGQAIADVPLADDSGDARGVLSHIARFHHGSYGQLVRAATRGTIEPAKSGSAEGPRGANSSDGMIVPLVLNVPTGDRTGGLAVFGERTGQFIFDPTIIVTTSRDVAKSAGWTSDEPVAIDRMIGRFEWRIPTGEQGGHDWRFTTSAPPAGWEQPDFDDSAWRSGKGGFGTPGTPGLAQSTTWRTPEIWLRATVELPSLADAAALVRFYHDEDIEIFVNGKRLLQRRGYVTSYQQHVLTADERALFRTGPNTIAVHCRQTDGGQGVDVGLGWIRRESL
jgi:hypothetical protein